jgi:hypothetical protein
MSRFARRSASSCRPGAGGGCGRRSGGGPHIRAGADTLSGIFRRRSCAERLAGRYSCAAICECVKAERWGAVVRVGICRFAAGFGDGELTGGILKTCTSFFSVKSSCRLCVQNCIRIARWRFKFKVKVKRAPGASLACTSRHSPANQRHSNLQHQKSATRHVRGSRRR